MLNSNSKIDFNNMTSLPVGWAYFPLNKLRCFFAFCGFVVMTLVMLIPVLGMWFLVTNPHQDNSSFYIFILFGVISIIFPIYFFKQALQQLWILTTPLKQGLCLTEDVIYLQVGASNKVFRYCNIENLQLEMGRGFINLPQYKIYFYQTPE